jgi:hypothetical protein
LAKTTVPALKSRSRKSACSQMGKGTVTEKQP